MNGWTSSSPNRRAKATCWPGVSGWSRKNSTLNSWRHRGVRRPPCRRAVHAESTPVDLGADGGTDWRTSNAIEAETGQPVALGGQVGTPARPVTPQGSRVTRRVLRSAAGSPMARRVCALDLVGPTSHHCHRRPPRFPAPCGPLPLHVTARTGLPQPGCRGHPSDRYVGVR